MQINTQINTMGSKWAGHFPAHIIQAIEMEMEPEINSRQVISELSMEAIDKRSSGNLRWH